MNEKLDDKKKWEIIGFIKVSSTRYKTLKILKNDFLIPSEIAKSTGLHSNQVSNALHDLKKMNLVVCQNENAKKGRVYQNTELGREILEILEKKKL